MRTPKHHDLEAFDFDFEGNGFSSDQWEISVPQNHCIIWSVVLPYLISANPEDEQQFKERLNSLTGDDRSPEKAKSAIWKFNPFINTPSNFSNETLRELTRCFRKVLEKNGSVKQGKTAEVWPLIASLLKCKLLLISFRSKTARLFVPKDSSGTIVDEDHSSTVETDDPSIAKKTILSADLPTLTVFFTESPSSRNDNPIRRFSFGLSEELCSKLRKPALFDNPENLPILSNVIA